jgi:hypothetical protein
MRKDLTDSDIADNSTGKLNKKYFNVKKGQYWCSRENIHLLRLIMLYVATNFAKIRTHTDTESQSVTFAASQTSIKAGQPLIDWSETEIRLRICKLLFWYDLADYKTTKWQSEDQIYAIAKQNKLLARQNQKKNVGGYPLRSNPVGLLG